MIQGLVFSVSLHLVLLMVEPAGPSVVAGDGEVKHGVSCRGKRTAGRTGMPPAAEERPGTPLSECT